VSCTIGEAVIMTRSGMSRRQVAPAAVFAPDIFEYVYLARPDSVIDGISVYRSRMAMGNALAREVQRVLTEKGISVDVVIPVPDTSRVAALNLAQALCLPYREGFVKNRYVGRTFIMPDQQMRYVVFSSRSFRPHDLFLCRKKSVRKKLNAMALEFVDKNVLIVDGKQVPKFQCNDRTPLYNVPESSLDSIVRGTTSREIIQMAKDVGAKKVIMASCAPPIRYPNVYGIDMPSRSELVAHGRTTEEVAEAIGADLVIFQTLEDLVTSVRGLNPSIEKFECSVFSGEYITGGVDEAYLDHLESIRSDNMKSKGGMAPTTASLGVADGIKGHATAGAKLEKASGNLVTGSGATERSVEGEGEGDSARSGGAVDDTIGLYNSWKQS
jgi:amidophosphoribosyltransferase